MAAIWFKLKALFSKKIKVIETPKIQITSTGGSPITEESREAYFKALATCAENRAREYPPWEDIVEALADAEGGDRSKLNVVIRRRRLVKQKYPKPTQEGINNGKLL